MIREICRKINYIHVVINECVPISLVILDQKTTFDTRFHGFANAKKQKRKNGQANDKTITKREKKKTFYI